MNRRKWFLHFLRAAIQQRKGRVFVAALAVMIAVAIIVSSIGISLGIRSKLGGELKAYGANVMITPNEGFLDEGVAQALKAEKGVLSYSMQLYSSVEVSGASVELMGMDSTPGWRLEGAMAKSPDEILAGRSLAGALALRPGSVVDIKFNGRVLSRTVSGIIESGGVEDSALIATLEAAQNITGLEGRVSAVLLRAESDDIDATVARLAKALPEARIKTLRQVADAEESFLAKVELLMALVTIVVLISSSISLSSTMSATVLERIKEIGLMKALGGTRREIGMFFIAEGASIGLIGGFAGFIIGMAAAQIVSKGAFGSFISIPLWLGVVSCLIGVGISVVSSAMPLLGALKYRPSVILRGE